MTDKTIEELKAAMDAAYDAWVAMIIADEISAAFYAYDDDYCGALAACNDAYKASCVAYRRASAAYLKALDAQENSDA